MLHWLSGLTWPAASAELEGHLLGHPDVGDVCVVGIPDERSGELPLAFVVLSGDAQVRIAKDEAEGVRKAIEGPQLWVLKPPGRPARTRRCETTS